jgi:hypothetical protein
MSGMTAKSAELRDSSVAVLGGMADFLSKRKNRIRCHMIISGQPVDAILSHREG